MSVLADQHLSADWHAGALVAPNPMWASPAGLGARVTFVVDGLPGAARVDLAELGVLPQPRLGRVLHRRLGHERGKPFEHADAHAAHLHALGCCGGTGLALQKSDAEPRDQNRAHVLFYVSPPTPCGGTANPGGARGKLGTPLLPVHIGRQPPPPPP